MNSRNGFLQYHDQISASALADEYNPEAPVPVYLTQPRTVGLALKVKFN